jgi:hypothetical protein
MYANAKMRPVESISGMGGGIKEDVRRGEFNSDIFNICRNICKCHNVPPPSKKEKKTVKK